MNLLIRKFNVRLIPENVKREFDDHEHGKIAEIYVFLETS